MTCENCEKLRSAREETLLAIETERRRFSMDLHDDICQRLSGLSMYCKSLASDGDPKIFLTEISELIDDTVTRIKNYAHNINPFFNEKQSLKDALEKLCRDAVRQYKKNIEINWNVNSDWPRDPEKKINLYRIAQEAMHNALKHSGADTIKINISRQADMYTLLIRDNGRGDVRLFDEKTGGFGLNSIHYRAAQLKGVCKINSNNAEGTAITVNVPYNL